MSKANDKVLDQRNLGGKTYGYCSCGRELMHDGQNEITCPLCEKTLVWNRLEVGDTIKCSTKEELVEWMTTLAKDDIETDFLYEKDGEKGYWLVVEKVGN